MTFGSLFAGIGGFDLGFERAGMRCIWQVEIDDFCRRVLAKHWPKVRRWDDVRTWPTDDAERPDVICGGFPCQDISSAGNRAGIDGERSGLWAEFARIIRVLRPRYVVVENVSALLARGLGRVLGDLAACGYDAEWDCIPASAVGAPHQRDRIWIVAYPQGSAWRRGTERRSSGNRRSRLDGAQGHVADPVNGHVRGVRSRREQTIGDVLRRPPGGASGERVASARSSIAADPHWIVEPDVGRVAHGVPARMDRLRGLGNAVVPQVAEWIGRRLMEWPA